MGYLADCECSGQNSRPIPIEEKFGGFCYDNFMFRESRPWIHSKGAVKRKLYKWSLRAKWVKFY
jgi:hypothetical protein